MNKKLLISFLLFFFVFSLVMLAEEKAQTIEHLVWADTLGGNCFYLKPVDHTVLMPFVSDPFLTFHVPASLKSDALFFELWAQSYFKWSDFQTRKAMLVVVFRIISGDIPDDIEVEGGATVFIVGEMNVGGNYDITSRRNRRNSKQSMRRNSVDRWNVTYKDTGARVPENIARNILKDLIANGFDVEVYTFGEIQGLIHICLMAVQFEVTRLLKN